MNRLKIDRRRMYEKIFDDCFVSGRVLGIWWNHYTILWRYHESEVIE